MAERETAPDVRAAGGLALDRLPAELRPSGALLRYYALASLVAGPLFFIPLTVLYFRYRTLRYRIDDDGIAMRWGALHRREVSLNYGRIQDIHLSSNVVERWLGLGKIQVQTASGSSGAEMTIEGVPEVRAMRDFLYQRMHGARAEAPSAAATPAESALPPGAGRGGGDDELAAVLRQIVDEVRALREEMAGTSATGPGDPADA